MKKQDITYQDKMNELRLDISHPNNNGVAFVFLEGVSDIRLFRKFFDLDNCKVENIPGGKLKLEECVSELVDNYPLIIGIRDADFLHLSTVPYLNPNMILTDLHDMEMTMVYENEVFSALMFEFTTLEKKAHDSIRTSLINSLEELSLLKWLNEIENLEYKFESGFGDLINFATFGCDFDQYFSRMLVKSPAAKIKDIQVVKDKINDLKVSNPDPFQLCNGHDLIGLIGFYFRSIQTGSNVGADNISSILRTSYTFENFKKTYLYRNCVTWAGIKNCTLFG